MTLARKQSRGITVRGQKFRWAIARPRRLSEPFHAKLTVQSESGDGSKLLAEGDIQSTGFPLWDPMYPVTPRHVQQAIEQALDSGWQPDIRGANWQLASDV